MKAAKRSVSLPELERNYGYRANRFPDKALANITHSASSNEL